MNRDKLQSLANELAKNIKTPDDLGQLSAMLTKLTVEAALKSEMNYHLGYDKSQFTGSDGVDNRNGYTTKTLKGDHGEIELKTPRVRDAIFEPQLVKKRQTRITGIQLLIASLQANCKDERSLPYKPLHLCQSKGLDQAVPQMWQASVSMQVS